MDNPLKQVAAQLEQLNQLLESTRADRDRWKERWELDNAKLVAAREHVQQAIEAMESLA